MDGHTDSCLNAPYGAPCFLTGGQYTGDTGTITGLNAPYGAPCFLTCCTVWAWRTADMSLNAPYGAPCFLTQRVIVLHDPTRNLRLNAPYGAPCFLTARRVAPAVTRGNDTSDRQGPKKHESDPQAQRQLSRLFVAIRYIATDGRQHSPRPGNSHRRRRVVPPHACTTPHAKQPTNHAQTRTPLTHPIPHTEAGARRAFQRDGPRAQTGATAP